MLPRTSAAGNLSKTSFRANVLAFDFCGSALVSHEQIHTIEQKSDYKTPFFSWRWIGSTTHPLWVCRGANAEPMPSVEVLDSIFLSLVWQVETLPSLQFLFPV